MKLLLIFTVISGVRCPCLTIKLFSRFLSLLIATIAVTSGLQAQISHNIDLYADIEITGDWRDVVVDGEILYFANAYGLMVYRFNPDEDQRPVVGRNLIPTGFPPYFLSD